MSLRITHDAVDLLTLSSANYLGEGEGVSIEARTDETLDRLSHSFVIRKRLPDDIVYRFEAVDILVDPESHALLDNATLEVEEGEIVFLKY